MEVKPTNGKDNADSVLCVSNLNKSYLLYEKPSDRLQELLFNKKKHNVFVALNNVSFMLERGKCLGVIGDNGSGKSTLLQLIAGVLKPTSGHMQIRGDVLGLLELGIGFHMEFTGRENIFFYSDVLGIPRSLIQSELNRIIEFSELGSFIDRPLKTYSTGMRMRLAFSLVSSLNPDILIIDEALAVGDLYFQKKCIDRLIKAKEEGRTIIFCSHSMYQIGMFCENALWLKQGNVERYGETRQVIAAYEAYQLSKEETNSNVKEKKYANALVRITEAEILNELPISRGDDLRLRVRTECQSDDLPFHVMVSIKFGADLGVYATGTHLSNQPPLRGKQREIIITYPNISLMGGFYWLHVRLFDDQGMIIYHEKIMTDPALEVRKDNNQRGVCYFENHWKIS